MQITNDTWLDPSEISSMVIVSGSDNFTLGLDIYMKSGVVHRIKHNPPYLSVYDVERRIKEIRNGV